jgi:outer membrane receptor protein involved in Fe transport
MRKVLFSALLVLISVMGFGSPDNDKKTPESEPKGGEIVGKIVDDVSNQPMEYTSIAVYNLSDSTLLTGTVSNTAGDFIIEEIPYGDYYLEIHFVGYEKQVFGPVVVNRDQRSFNVGEVKLEINRNSLAEVEVVAQQKRVEYKIDKKVVNVGEDLNASGGTAVDVLENTPSVSVDIEGNVTMRGSGSFTVLINGKPTILDASDALRQIPASNIQNIEIITNPSVKYDPDGNAGIINVVLKKQVERGTTGIINAMAGVNNKYSLDALINRRVGKLNYFLGGGYNNNTHVGSIEREHITLGDTENHYNVADGGFNFVRGGAQLKAGFDYDISPKTNIALEGSGGTYKFGMGGPSNSHEYSVLLPLESNESFDDVYSVNESGMLRDGNYYSGNLNLSHTFDSSDHKIVAMASLSHRNNSGITDMKYFLSDENFNVLPTEVPEENRNVETGDSYEYRYQVDYTRPIGKGKLEAGYQGRIESSLDDFQYQEFDPDTDSWNTLGDRSSEITFSRNIQGAYVQYGGMLGKIQYQLGIRGEYTKRLIEYENFNSSYEIDRFDYYPTVHFSRQLENDQQLMASYSKRVNRPRSYFLDSIPNYVDKQTMRIGNPGLEPEYVNSFELGYQKGWGRNFLALEAYYRNTTNKMTRVTEFNEADGIFVQKMENINEDHTVGSELMLNWMFGKLVTLNASTSAYYYNIQGELFGESVDASNISWRANTNATVNYSKTGRIQTTIGYRGPSVTAQGSSEGMFYTNLAVRQDFFNRKLSATLQVRDLFGTMKRDFTSSGTNFEQHVIMALEPRVVMLTLSYKINNYRVDPRKQGRGEDGMEMDSGF